MNYSMTFNMDCRSLKRNLLLIFLIGCLGLPLPVFSQSFQGSSDYPLQKVLIVYGQRYIFGDVNDYVQYFGLLLKHFHTKTTFCDVRTYHRGQMEHYDQIFYLGLTSDSATTDDFLSDAAKTSKRLCWMGYRVEKLLKFRPDWGVRFQGYSNAWIYNEYQSHRYIENPMRVNSLLQLLNEKVKTWAKISDGVRYRPYALSLDNLWVFSRVDFGEDSGEYIMADLFHQVLHEEHPAMHRAFIWIEDVYPFTDAARFRKILKILIRHQIPFMMAVTPVYSDGKNSAATYLSDRPQLVKVIRYGVRNRGSVVLHDFAYQNGSAPTGETLEIWYSRHNRLLGHRETALIREHLQQGINECLQNGILPLTFEPGHFSLSQNGCRQIAKCFSTLVGQIQTSDLGLNPSSFPFVLYSTDCGQYVIPENLPNADPAGNGPLSAMRMKARKLEIVRDATAGVYFRSSVEPRYLEAVIGELSHEGYQFFDLRVFPNPTPMTFGNFKPKSGLVASNGLWLMPFG